MRKKSRRRHSRRPAFACESLETRQLLSANWSLQDQLIGLDKAAQNYPNVTGAGETVVLIDQGVDYNHPALGGGVGPGHKIVAAYDFVDGGTDVFPYDGNVHGTGSAGQVAADPHYVNGQLYQGVAPGVNLVVLKAAGTDNAKAAFDWVVANRAAYNVVAVNYVDPASSVNLNALVGDLQQLRDAGVFVAGPVGNYGPGPAYASPGDLIYLVGSTDLNDQLSSFTPRGSAVDMVAPGGGVDITWYQDGQSVDTISNGTSWAGPQVVGAAALVKQVNPSFTVAQVLSILRDSAHWVYDAYSNTSYPRLDVNAAIGLAYQRSAVQQQPPAPVVTPPPAPAPKPVETPFLGTPFSVGQTIEAENYDSGGEGVAYHDLTSWNQGDDSYRNDGVDLRSEAASDGTTRFVGWTQPGEWLNYTVNVATAGTYDFTARVASDGGGGAFHVEVDGKPVTASIAVPDTGGWQNYADVKQGGIQLATGRHVVRVVIDGANGTSGYAGNFNWFRFNAAAASSPAPSPQPTPSPAPTPTPTPVPSSDNSNSSLTVTAASTESLVISWLPLVNGGVSEVLERSTSPTGHFKALSTIRPAAMHAGKKVTAKQYTDHHLMPGATYYYRLAVKTSRGRTYYVQTASGTTLWKRGRGHHHHHHAAA